MYTFEDRPELYTCFSFEEANILMQNYNKQDLTGIIARLDNLLRNTADPYLCNELSGVIAKLQTLTPDEYKLLARDIERNEIVFPPDYRLPHLD